MQIQITLKFDVEVVGVEARDRYQQALEALADVMIVQAEDGLYDKGWPDSEEPNEHIAHLTLIGQEVEIVDWVAAEFSETEEV